MKITVYDRWCMAIEESILLVRRHPIVSCFVLINLGLEIDLFEWNTKWQIEEHHLIIAQCDIFFDRIATWNKLWYNCCLTVLRCWDCVLKIPSITTKRRPFFLEYIYHIYANIINPAKGDILKLWHILLRY